MLQITVIWIASAKYWVTTWLQHDCQLHSNKLESGSQHVQNSHVVTKSWTSGSTSGDYIYHLYWTFNKSTFCTQI